MANRIQKNKLLLSKWSAVAPQDREKHFLVTQVLDDDPTDISVILEAQVSVCYAVLSKAVFLSRFSRVYDVRAGERGRF